MDVKLTFSIELPVSQRWFHLLFKNSFIPNIDKFTLSMDNLSCGTIQLGQRKTSDASMDPTMCIAHCSGWLEKQNKNTKKKISEKFSPSGWSVPTQPGNQRPSLRVETKLAGRRPGWRSWYWSASSPSTFIIMSIMSVNDAIDIDILPLSRPPFPGSLSPNTQ